GLPGEPAPPLLPRQEAATGLRGRSHHAILGHVPWPVAALDRAGPLHDRRGAARVPARGRCSSERDGVLLDLDRRGDGAVLDRAVAARALLVAGFARRRAPRGARLAAARRR